MEQINDLVIKLSTDLPEDRNEAMIAIRSLTVIPRNLLERLECLAANDPDASVRGSAAAVIDLPAAREARRQRISGLNPYVLRALADEITQWQSQGLIHPGLANILKSRYAVTAAPAVVEPPRPSPAPKTSLSQALFSETSIRTFLYLGAFFVVAASLILATLVETLRLPILMGLFVAFGITALSIKKRLPQPSFVLFIVSTLMIPITANVLFEQLSLSPSGENIYRVATYALLAAGCGLGTWLYSSRLLSIAAFVSAVISSFFLARLFTSWITSLDFTSITLGVANLIALGLIIFLRISKKGQKFVRPLFWTAQLIQLGLLGNIAFYSLTHYYLFGIQDVGNRLGWVIAGAADLLGGVFYFASFWAGGSKRIFPGLAAIVLSTVPFLIAQAFEPKAVGQVTVLLVSGGGLMILSEAFRRIKLVSLPDLSNGLLIGAAGLFAAGMIFGGIDLIESSASPLLFSASLTAALFLAAAQILRPRWVVWSGTLFAALIAYLAFFNLPGIRHFETPAVVIWLILSFVFLLPDTIFRGATIGTAWGWRLPLLSAGAIASFVTCGIILSNNRSDPASIDACIAFAAFFMLYAWRRNANIAFAAFAILTAVQITQSVSPILWISGFVFSALLALLSTRGKPYICYSAAALAALSLVSANKFYNLEYSSIVLSILAVVYFGVGFFLRRAYSPSRGSAVLEISGLALCTLTSLTALIEHSPIQVYAFIPAVIAALLWTSEAFIHKNVYLGFPANALYLMSFCTLIFSLDVKEPQAYSIAAAAIGFLQYHLLIRSGKPQVSAFITGGVAMLILLGTTYIQMLATEQLKFFALLFFQSLFVLVYGIIIRSRSLFGFPIVAAIVGVITVVLFILQGLSTVIIIGGTGILMIGVGIAAVLMRERIAKMGSILSEWKA